MERMEKYNGSGFRQRGELDVIGGYDVWKDRTGYDRSRMRPAQQVRKPVRNYRQQRAHRRRQVAIAVLEILCIVGSGFFLAMLVRGMAEGKVNAQGDFSPARGEEIGNLNDDYDPAAGMDETQGDLIQGISADVFARHPQWEENYLTPNEYSRPGEPLTEVKNIFVHYTANPGTSAAQNRSYFEQQKDTHENSVSSHFIIGYEGEILQIVPLDEIAYAVKSRNMDSISIECCYKAKDGSFTQETYDSLISLLSWLTEAYDLDSEDILRHYDCGGKKCPLYYTEHEDAWEQLKQDVKNFGKAA